MHIVRKYRFLLAAILVIVIGGALAVITYEHLRPLPENTSFKTRFFSFTYPRVYDAQEYAPGVVSVGHKKGDGLDPLIDVVRYQSDPDVATPTTFDNFMKLQAAALCGADGPVESITCTQIGVTAVGTTTDNSIQQLNLTLVRKNLKTGTTTSSTYGPMYVFNTTTPPDPQNPLRYSAIFIYPSLSAFLDGTTSPQLMGQVFSSFLLPAPVSSIK